MSGVVPSRSSRGAYISELHTAGRDNTLPAGCGGRPFIAPGWLTIGEALTSYVTQLSDDPGIDLEYSIWMVIETEISGLEVIERACKGLLAYLESKFGDLSASDPREWGVDARLELERRGISDAALNLATYVYTNS